MLLHGFHPVRELLRARPGDVARVVVGDNAQRSRDRQIREICGRNDVAIETGSSATLDQLTEGALHNGFVAELREGVEATVVPTTGDSDLVVLVEDVEDPRNLGAILRVCDGAGVGKVLIRDRGSAPVSAAAVKTSAGAAEHLSIERVTNSTREIERLQEAGFWVYGADGSGDPIWEVELSGKVCFVLGGEEKGLRPRTKKSCDRLVALPMRGAVESLNVATAAAALLFEAVRQRRERG